MKRPVYIYIYIYAHARECTYTYIYDILFFLTLHLLPFIVERIRAAFFPLASRFAHLRCLHECILRQTSFERKSLH